MKKKQPLVNASNVGTHGEYKTINHLLMRASAIVYQQRDQVVRAFNLTAPQFSALGIIRSRRGISSADLARRSLKTPQTMSVIVANLEKMGLIVRHPHPVYKKVQRLEITDAGVELHNRCREKVWENEKEMMLDCTDEEEKMIRQWLLRMIMHYEPLDDEAYLANISGMNQPE